MYVQNVIGAIGISSLLRHEAYECTDKGNQYACGYCGKRSSLRCNLLKHIRSKHPYKDIVINDGKT